MKQASASLNTVSVIIALCAVALFPLYSRAADSSGDDSAATATPPLSQRNPLDTFSGSWLSSVGDDRFTLNLTQTGDRLSGYHVSVREKGGRTDSASSTTQPPSITGTVAGPVVIVRIRSGAPGSEGYGHARLTLRDRYLYWQLIDFNGTHYLPDNAVLIRQEKG